MTFLSASTLRIVILAVFVYINIVVCFRPINIINLNDYEQQYGMQDEQPFLRSARSRIQRRDSPCLINAGLSQGCDLSDILYAKYQANKFSSFAGPGRR